MPEVDINIGGRSFEVACQEGEEHYLEAAARMLDKEAQVLNDQIGRLPEARMLLMAGLMLADKTAGLEDRLRDLEDRCGALQSEVERLKAQPGGGGEPQRVEVPVVPAGLTEALEAIAARAEAVAAEVEEKAAG